MEKCNGFIDVISVLKFHIGLTPHADLPGHSHHACLFLSHLRFIKVRSSAETALESDVISGGALTFSLLQRPTTSLTMQMSSDEMRDSQRKQCLVQTDVDNWFALFGCGQCHT